MKDEARVFYFSNKYNYKIICVISGTYSDRFLFCTFVTFVTFVTLEFEHLTYLQSLALAIRYPLV